MQIMPLTFSTFRTFRTFSAFFLAYMQKKIYLCSRFWNSMAQKKYWNTEITPKDRLLAIDWKEVWRYRDLFWLFVLRNFRVAYKQTVLGPLWFIITPVLSVIVYVAVFGGVANIQTDGVPPALFWLLGISIWGYFASCLTATSNSFVTNSDIFGKVYFPRIIMPLVAVTTNMLSLLIQLGIFAVFYVYYALTGATLAVTWHIVLFPVLIIVLALMAVGFGMAISSMTTKYRDLQIIFSHLVNFWMYLTPVIYPLSMVKKNATLMFIMQLNPVTPILEAIKFSLLGVGTVSWTWLGYSVLMMVIMMTIGLAMFNKVQKSFMDTV